MTNYAQVERQALCDTFLAVGPDAPTLCSGWSTADLAAHLVIRESRPDLAAGILVPALAGRLDAAMSALAGRTPWPELVERVRQGPPRWAPSRLARVDALMNTAEFLVHHEDVLRADPQRPVRTLDPGLQRTVWSMMGRMGAMMARRCPTGLVLVAEGFGRTAVRGPGEHGTVVARGLPTELLLFLYGRQQVAQVELTGDPADIELARGADYSI